MPSIEPILILVAEVLAAILAALVGAYYASKNLIHEKAVPPLDKHVEQKKTKYYNGLDPGYIDDLVRAAGLDPKRWKLLERDSYVLA